jgi:hypothetical protein
MLTARTLDRAERERIRLAFFCEYRHLQGFSSVSVRRHPDSREWCVYVGAARHVDLPASFEGLPVIAYPTGVAIHAVAYPPTSCLV